MDATVARTCAEEELGAGTAQFQVGTLPALLREAEVCQCSRFLGSSEWLMGSLECPPCHSLACHLQSGTEETMPCIM